MCNKNFAWYEMIFLSLEKDIETINNRVNIGTLSDFYMKADEEKYEDIGNFLYICSQIQLKIAILKQEVN